MIEMWTGFRRVRFWGPSAFWRTLRFRFAFWVGSLLLLTQIALGIFVYVRLEDRLLDTVDDTLRLNAVQIRALIEAQEGDLTRPESTAYSSLTSELQEQSLTARILSPRGEIVQAYGIYRDMPIHDSTLAAVQKRRENLITIPDPNDPEDHVRVFAVPILDQDVLVGVVEVTQTLESVDDTLEQLLTLFQIAVPVSVIIAALGGYGLSSRALSRVDRITAMAHRISAEDLAARLDLPATNDEVGRLAKTFDMMLGRLQASFQRERQFTSDASHELRTPLAAMRTILDLTRSKRRSVEEYERALDDLAEETARLHGLVTDLLRLARNETPDDSLGEVVDLSALLRDISDSLRPLAENNTLKLVCAVPDGLTLYGNRDQLVRLFVNLLDNAIKFTDHGEITVDAARQPDRCLAVTIADTGSGISAEHLPHIFDRFYRIDASRTAAGTGLGLTIAQSIARSHGGTIEVESQVGKGSEFRVLLCPVSPD
jgi:heavy metal sensor kinase